MAELKEKKTDVIHIPTAKRHKVLEDIAEQVGGTEISDTFEVANHKYHMSTLTADEEVWSDTYTNVSSPMSAISSIKIPKLAASIKAIDGVKIDDLFEFANETNEADVRYHTESQYRKRYWEMGQMLLWLGDRPNTLITDLWQCYVKLLERRDESWDKLKKSSARILGGNLKATFSPEKESSPATQMSNV